ncbi:hypothetical protein DL93DRAFT_2082104 [Clavulina sp. PMI_390]|nr:hypothetical protein DL93DRAFT_2082104 [Clavulina sp. PMI_390]
MGLPEIDAEEEERQRLQQEANRHAVPPPVAPPDAPIDPVVQPPQPRPQQPPPPSMTPGPGQGPPARSAATRSEQSKADRLARLQKLLEAEAQDGAPKTAVSQPAPTTIDVDDDFDMDDDLARESYHMDAPPQPLASKSTSRVRASSPTKKNPGSNRPLPSSSAPIRASSPSKARVPQSHRTIDLATDAEADVDDDFGDDSYPLSASQENAMNQAALMQLDYDISRARARSKSPIKRASPVKRSKADNTTGPVSRAGGVGTGTAASTQHPSVIEVIDTSDDDEAMALGPGGHLRQIYASQSGSQSVVRDRQTRSRSPVKPSPRKLPKPSTIIDLSD